MKVDLFKVRRVLIASGQTEAILGRQGLIVRPGFRCTQDWYYVEPYNGRTTSRRAYHGPIFIHSYIVREQSQDIREQQLERYATILRSSVKGFLKLPDADCFYLELVSR